MIILLLLTQVMNALVSSNTNLGKKLSKNDATITWKNDDATVNYKLDRISNYPENFTEKLEFLTRNEIAIIEYFLKNQPLQDFESKAFSNSISEPLQ